VWACREYTLYTHRRSFPISWHTHVLRLAYCELYVTLGTFFRRFGDLKVFETTPDDMDYDDFFSSYHVPEKKWFKAYRKPEVAS
jgi:hypothetical protein